MLYYAALSAADIAARLHQFIVHDSYAQYVFPVMNIPTVDMKVLLMMFAWASNKEEQGVSN